MAASTWCSKATAPRSKVGPEWCGVDVWQMALRRCHCDAVQVIWSRRSTCWARAPSAPSAHPATARRWAAPTALRWGPPSSYRSFFSSLIFRSAFQFISARKQGLLHLFISQPHFRIRGVESGLNVITTLNEHSLNSNCIDFKCMPYTHQPFYKKQFFSHEICSFNG